MAGNEKILDSRRIARNTLILYGRTLIIMLVGLYTSRVNLDSLGVENFGIYNVVGGMVAMVASLKADFMRLIGYCNSPCFP